MAQNNKPFSRAKNAASRVEKTKGRIAHKINSSGKKTATSSSDNDRDQKLKMRAMKKKEAQEQQRSISASQRICRGVPRVISMVPLSPGIDCASVWNEISTVCELRIVNCPIDMSQETDYSAAFYISDSFKTTFHPIYPVPSQEERNENNNLVFLTQEVQESNSQKLGRSPLPMVEQCMFSDFIMYITNENGPDSVGRSVVDSVNRMKLKQQQFVFVINSDEKNSDILLANAILNINITSNETEFISNNNNGNNMNVSFDRKIKKFSDKHLRFLESFFSPEAVIYAPYDNKKTAPIFIRNISQSALQTAALQQYISMTTQANKVINAQNVLQLAPWNMLRPMMDVCGVTVDQTTGLLNIYGFVRGALPLSAKQVLYLQGIGEMEIAEICGMRCDFSSTRELPSMPMPIISNRTMYSIADQHSMERRSNEDFVMNNEEFFSAEQKGLCNVDGTMLFRNSDEQFVQQSSDNVLDNEGQIIENDEANLEGGAYTNNQVYNNSDDNEDDNEENNEEDANNNILKDIENKMAARLSEQDIADRFKFADEIDIHPNLPIHQALRGWRGVKSLRTSSWTNPHMNEPEEYKNLFQPSQPMQISALCVRDLLNNEQTSAQPGTFVSVLLKPNYNLAASYYFDENVNLISPSDLVMGIYNLILKQIVISGFMFAVGLFRHETKDGLLHSRLIFDSIGSKEIIGQYTKMAILVGFRRLYVQPLFSTPVSPEKSRVERYAYGQNTYTVSFPSPIFVNFESLPPMLACVDSTDVQSASNNEDELIKPVYTFFNNIATDKSHTNFRLVAYGKSSMYDVNQYLIQRIILCGDPFHISRRRTTIRCMFFCQEDVKYFSPIELTTKGGRTGTIISSIGTKGYFKAFFDSPITHSDEVMMKLYKRVYPSLDSVRLDSTEENYHLNKAIVSFNNTENSFNTWHKAIADCSTIEEMRTQISNINQ